MRSREEALGGGGATWRGGGGATWRGGGGAIGLGGVGGCRETIGCGNGE